MNPLQFEQSLNENSQQRIETIIMVPRHCEDDSSGGQCQFIFPNNGYLSADSRVIIPATCADEGYQYCPAAGVFSLIKQANLRIGDVLVAQIDRANQLYAMRENLNHLEKREQIDQVLHGISSSFQTCSGSKRDANSGPNTLPGQYRLVGSNGYKQQLSQVPGHKNALPILETTQISDAYKLKTFYNNKVDEAGTPEFCISLGQLFPAFFDGISSQLPLQLINDEVSLELVFSNNSTWALNERAIICPDLQVAGATAGVINVGMITSGSAYTDGTDIYQRPDGGGTESMKIKYDVVAGIPQNISVVDVGTGYYSGSELVFTDPAAGGGDTLLLTPGKKLMTNANSTDFIVLTGGANYANGPATLVDPDNSSNSVDCTIVVNATAVASVEIDANDKDKFLDFQDSATSYQITTGDGLARVKASSRSNFIIMIPGIGYTDGQQPGVIHNPVNPECNATCQLTVVGGAVERVTIDKDQLQRFVTAQSPGLVYYISSATVPYPAPVQDPVVPFAGCEIHVCDNIFGPLTTDALQAGKTFSKGDLIHVVVNGDNNGTNIRAIVFAVDAGNKPTHIDLTLGKWPDTYPIAIQLASDNGNFLNITAGFGPDVQVQDIQGSGPNGLQGYDTNVGDDGKINIVTSKVRLATDLIFYEDGKLEADAKAMMTSKGLVKIYSQYVNVSSSIQGGTAVNAYGEKSSIDTIRIVGYSNEVLRGLLFQNYCSGTQDKADFEYEGMPKKNPLLMNYGSRCSLVEDGSSLQVVLNSVPRYPAPIKTSPYFFTELSQVFEKPFYLPHGCYNGSSSCKQRDSQALTINSAQPGFSTDDSIDIATGQYELNNRKSGIANVSYQGINQKYLRGNGFYMGVNLRKINGQNFVGNGMKIGAQSVEVQYNYEATKNPWFSGTSTLNTYGIVERIFQLQNGKVSVTTASS